MLLNRWRSDRELLDEARRGNATATKTLVKRLSARALGLAKSLVGNLSDAEDLVQESFIKLFNQANFVGQSQLATYFHQIVSRTCIDFLRTKKEFVELNEDDYDIQSELELPTAIDNECLKRALAQLHPRHRMVLTIWAYQDASMQSIADTFDLDVNAAKQLLHRAKLSLKQNLEGMSHE